MKAGTVAGAQTVVDALENAVRNAQQGRIDIESPLLARSLASVDFGGGEQGGAGIPDDDLLALAAWSLIMLVIRGRFHLVTCPICAAPWLAPDDRNPYCTRPAPGRSRRSCRDVNRERELHDEPAYALYRREYKRITESVRRGALSQDDADAWRRVNNHEMWKPFNDWLKTPDGRRHLAKKTASSKEGT